MLHCSRSQITKVYSGLKEAVVHLGNAFPSAAFTYVDVYCIKRYYVFKEPNKYGFELPFVACCGYGDIGYYNYSIKALTLIVEEQSLTASIMQQLPSNSISLFCFFCMLLSSSYAKPRISSPAFAANSCNFPAIFNFGDSNSDTGGISAALYPINWPYGQTYFHMPAGRFSDGRLIIDFIAESFGLPYLSAYLDSVGTNFSHGANFATGGSTIRVPDRILPTNEGFGFSPFYLDIQLSQFMLFKSRSQMIRQRGGIYASLMPQEEYFSQALYTFDIGQNDFTADLFADMPIEKIYASVPDSIYNSGGRSFWIHNTGPLGCYAFVFLYSPSAPALKDSAGCVKPYNELAQYFNLKLKEAVVQLRKAFPSAAFTYVDVYSIKYSLFKEPEKYGFELPLVACCGYGGIDKYNFSLNAVCGASGLVNGTKIVVDSSCDRPSARVSWDGVHFTEAANKFIFDQISTGDFSDPPIPPNMACHREGQLKALGQNALVNIS
ncbi:GDSL esterase/lipase [Citrus sinensis]|uniref:GDSL esterase/lipase n=1 Tax=Citrus sinensis TaxID=2711 RepID=A0ACB8KRR6_CITSI|nr:GDSL esterase/lipase [Citrus sinensis]